MVPILILAAGASSRMGGADKLLMDVDDLPLLRRQVRMALEVSDDVRVALPPRPHPRYAAVQDLPVQQVEVADASEGMGASLRTVFATLESDVTHAMLLLTDLPDLTADDLRTVVAASQNDPDALIWRGATPKGVGGHPIIFAASLFDDIQTLTGDSGGQSIVAKASGNVRLVRFEDDRARRDLDTPEDWAAWRADRSKGIT